MNLAWIAPAAAAVSVGAAAMACWHALAVRRLAAQRVAGDTRAEPVGEPASTDAMSGAQSDAAGASQTQAASVAHVALLSTWTKRLVAAAALSWLGAFLVLAWAFVASRLDVGVVFFYSSTELPLAWKMVGVWASRQGSFLVWVAALATMTWVLHARMERRAAAASVGLGSSLDAPILGAMAVAAMSGITALFAVASALDAPFGATPAGLLSGTPTGNGLTPTLRSAYMLIHPPMMFVAYALSAVPAAAALAYLLGASSWSSWTAGWTRWAWVVTTCAMGLGALWAYTTLGFGGYWSWDPVEVANLLPWLALTVLLHARRENDRHRAFARVGPLLAMLPLVLTLFSTVSTRSGLWVSVHAFTDPTNTFNPDAAGRFLDILRAEPALAYPVALGLGFWWTFLAAWSWRLARETHPRTARILCAVFAAVAGATFVDATGTMAVITESARILAGGNTAAGLLAILAASALAAASPILLDRSPGRRLAMDLRGLAGYAVLALATALLVMVLLHMAAVNGWDTRFYESRFPYLALPILGGLAGFAAHSWGRRASWVAALGVPLAALAVARAGWPGAGLAGASLAIAAIGAWRIRGLLPRGRGGAAAWLLVLAAAADVVFWIHPPAVLGGLRLPQPPASFVLAAGSLLALAAVVRLACGAVPPRAHHLFVAVGLLGGYGVGTLGALVAWILWRKAPLTPGWSAGRARQVALHGVHIALALSLVGYAASTYARSSATLELDVGETETLGGWDITYLGTPAVAMPGIPSDAVAPRFWIGSGPSAGPLEGHLGWHRATGTYLASPDQHESWNADVYLDVQAIHVAAGGVCPNAPEGRWLEAFQVEDPPRVCQGDVLDQVRVSAVVLPGLAVLWGAWALGMLCVVALAVLRDEPRRTAGSASVPAGDDLSHGKGADAGR